MLLLNDFQDSELDASVYVLCVHSPLAMRSMTMTALDLERTNAESSGKRN